MPLFTTLAALSQTAASNSPDGTVDAPSTIDDQLRLLASFIAQLRDNTGFTNPPLVVGANSGGVATTPQAVAFSATPTFDASKSNVHTLGALTANVTSVTVTNPINGQALNIRFVQDATGGRTVTLGSSFAVVGSINTSANKVSWLSVIYSSISSQWEGAWTALP